MRIAIHDYAGHPFIFDLSRELARRGNEVCHFYFNGDKGPKGAVDRLPDDPPTFSIEAVGIDREYSKVNYATRWVNDRDYGKNLAAALRAFRPDVILSANTPLESQKIIMGAAKAMGSKFVFWMQDFYSLAVQRLMDNRWFGLGNLIGQYYFQLEKTLLQASDRVIYISPDFVKPAEKFHITDSKTVIIQNWASIDSISVRPKTNAWAKQQGLDGKKVFLYSGTLALKHNPAHLRALAERFSDRDDVVVVVAARGVGMDALKRDLEARPLPSLKLIDLQPLHLLPEMLGAADVLIALLEADAGEFSVPSKVLSYYCAARPVLMSAPLENLASRTTLEQKCGLVSPPHDVDGFLAAAGQLLDDARLRGEMGSNARRYAEAHFEIERIADRFEALLRSTVPLELSGVSIELPKATKAKGRRAMVHSGASMHSETQMER